jgi:hypothetical protein
MGHQARLRNQIDATISAITELIAVIWDSHGTEDILRYGKAWFIALFAAI